MGLPQNYDLIRNAVRRELAKHGSYRDAGRALGIDHGYLHKIYHDKAPGVSDEVLAKLGLKRVVVEAIVPLEGA